MARQSLGIQMNAWFEKYMFILIPLSLVLGVLCSPLLIEHVSLVPWLFGLVTFVMGLGCGWKDIMAAFRRPLLFLIVFVITHLVAPLLAYGFGAALFGSDSSYTIGLVLFAVIPLGISSVLWVEMARGAVPIMLALVVVDSLLSPIVVPLSLSLLYEQSIPFDGWTMLIDLLLIIVLPTLAGIVVHEWTQGQAKPRMAPVLLPLSKLAFVGVVLLNAAAIGPFVRTWDTEAFIVFAAVCSLVAAFYALGHLTERLWPPDSSPPQSTLGFASGMRNISLGLVLALQHFGAETAVAVVLAILIQQPGATIYYSIIRRRQRVIAGNLN
ncbi:bile acid:sodium symporter [Paenibacillus sp. SC116]|uniref:bile acid:sodium symporter family protein n=1 Tax=Paenibacillus sp. SC116 TaxID=2968986 RepID=UPI00215B07EC|nr:bile acid:sodium symporter [Paenibacillus sp. SC116]MCR8843654.1 bile acid:sodium symporter [Paenibacillus sp. SC116]